jgi:SAM-dependent methyltransferase
VIDPTYDSAFFSFCTRWEADYGAVADWLQAFLDFDSALDLGCGNAYVVAGLRRAGRQAVGVEVARDAALPFMPADVREFVGGYDFLRVRPEPADLVICTEVAEHLFQREGKRLVRVIAQAARKWVFFTAATPGQGGHHHVNEQPNEYWIRKFQRNGMRLDDIKTHFARRILGEKLKDAKFLAKNAMIFSVDSPG